MRQTSYFDVVVHGKVAHGMRVRLSVNGIFFENFFPIAAVTLEHVFKNKGVLHALIKI